MAYTTIKKPSDYFNTKLYTGNGSTQSITGVGFQPDMTWIKSRTTGGGGNNNHCINDVVRAKGSFGYPMIHPNLTASEYDPTSGNEVITDFQSDGFDLGGNENSNYNTATYASWNWLANGTGVSNTDGSITSTVSANTTSGFSIVSYSGNGTNGATVGHGLGVAPKTVIVKARTTGNTQNWFVNYPFGTGDGYIMLNSTNAGDGANSSVWNSTTPNSSTVTLGTTSGVNDASYDYIMYCFADVKGFSKFGSYVGNGNSDGTFVYTGFKPAFVLLKNYSAAGDSWQLHDNKRLGYNVDNNILFPNTSATESTADVIDILSNGFKLRTTASGWNSSGGSYIYMCFAENPFVTSTSIPCTAR